MKINIVRNVYNIISEPKKYNLIKRLKLIYRAIYNAISNSNNDNISLENTLDTSYYTSHLIVKYSKSFINSEFIKNVLWKI